MKSGEVTARGRGSSLAALRARHDRPYASRARRQHRDAVAEVERLLDVVGDEHDGARLLDQTVGQPLLHLGARDRVERSERLVEQQHRLAGQQRSRKGDALAHAAGELTWTGRGELAETELLEHRQRLPARLAARGARQLQRQRRVVERAAPGQQQVVLEHQRAALEPPQRVGLPADLDAALGGLREAADQLEQRRLSAARAADDSKRLAAAEAQVELLERGDLALACAEALQDRGDDDLLLCDGRPGAAPPISI